MPETIYIDVGGTKIAAWRRDARGRLRLLARRPAADGAARAVSLIRRTSPGAAIVVGSRGVWTPAEKSARRREWRLGRNDRVLSDIELAHELAFGGGPGIVLNAGTGSIAFGRNAAGQTARAGGLGPLLGDEGSGFWIGREYLVRVRTRREPMSALRPIAARRDAVAAIASLAPHVMRLAQRGNLPARRIISEAQDALVSLVQQAAGNLRRPRTAKKQTLPLVLKGGIFESEAFRSGFKRALRRRRTGVYLPPVT